MSEKRSYYQVLHISTTASQEEIEQAYQRLIARIRERLAGGEAPSLGSFDQLNEAFSVLRDPAQRAAYDAKLTGSSAFSDPAAANPGGELPLSFHGNGGEYFRIWIVNLLLSILTLGIYSAWAKVRREQYFHRNLLLDGSGFEYHATPWAILKGRIIAVILFAGLSASEYVSLGFYFGCLVVFVFIVPWLLVRAYRFRARNTSFRGLRFHFVGEYGGALKAYLGWFLLTMISFGMLAPFWIRAMRAYAVNNLRYGHGEFRLDASVGKIYGIVFLPFLALLAFWIVLGIIVGVGAAAGFSGGAMGDFKSENLIIMFGGVYILAILFYVAVFAYIQMGLQNHFWSTTTLDAHKFSCNMRLGKYFRIVLKNIVLMMLTLGLYWPWAKVALVSYRASQTSMTVNGSLDQYVAAATAHSNAVGDETAEMFDFDIGF